MGESYVIINLTKQEFLDPWVFGDGLKLLEFTRNKEGVLQAQAILTDTSPGNISRMVYASEPDFEPKFGEKIASEFVHSRNHLGWLPGGETCVQRIIVPACAGRWAGDRVITAGAYTEAYKFMTKVQQLRGQERAIKQKRQDLADKQKYYKEETHDLDDELARVTCNIYDYAGWEFKNISDEVRDQLLLFGVGHSTEANFGAIAENMLRHSLFLSYPHTITTGKGKNTRHKWDLSWMSYQELDTFLIRWESAGEFNRAKAWLRKQQLQVWQQELIKLYKYHARPSLGDIKLTLVVHGCDKIDPQNVDIQAYHPILPSKPYLDAALKLERAMKKDPETATIAADGDQTRLAEALGMPVRQRVITID